MICPSSEPRFIPVRTRFFIILSVLLLSGIAFACQVPVFRFALERWNPDAYGIKVFPGPSGKFTPDEQAAVDFLTALRQPAGADSGVFANLAVETSSEPSSENGGKGLVISYPQKHRGFSFKPIETTALTLENAKRLVDSPARRELVKRLLSGESAVWVLLESGNTEADEEAMKTLVASNSDAKGLLKIPDGVMTRSDAESEKNFTAVNADDILRSEVPLKIDFSVIRVRRDDPAEALFIPMLLGIEDDLHEFAAEPLVFPVFGRGRLLAPLIGRGVTRDNIIEYSTYICGACSCEVKDQNPGVDLLITADWDTALHGSEVVMEKILPPLEGTALLVGADHSAIAEPATIVEDPPASEPTPGPSAGLSLQPVFLTVGVLFLGVVFVSLFLTRRKST
jgi:hypothetical protein